MTPLAYRAALTTLSLTNDQAAIWLGVGRSTAFRYANEGAPGPVERALMMAVLVIESRWSAGSEGEWRFIQRLISSLDLPEPSLTSPVHKPTHIRAGE